jgi:hypothetical protein
MESVAFILAGFAPEDLVIEQLGKSCQDYMKEPTENNRFRVITLAAMFLTKTLIKDKAKEEGKTPMQAIEELMNSFDEDRRRRELFKPSEQ